MAPSSGYCHRMPLLAFDHINLCTRNVAELLAFYTEGLGLSVGPRPNFSFNGAWLYCGGRPVLHLVERLKMGGPEGDLQIQHFAFSGRDLKALLNHLAARGVAHWVTVVEDFELCQINVHDPDGNHVHLDYPLAEARALGIERTPLAERPNAPRAREAGGR